jgi:hypothetical protein
MLSHTCLQELQHSWLPNFTDAGLGRLIELLEQGSPLLIHGSFTRAVPQGCLATHAAWHHPATRHLTVDAGVMWLNRVAGLNPATSQVIREWDHCGTADYEIRCALIAVLKKERQDRRDRAEPATEPEQSLAAV